jgi:hypothetical protein
MPLKSSALDIYENPTTVNMVEKVRSFRTELDTPFIGDRRISFHSERLRLSDDLGETAESVLARNQEPVVTRLFNEVATEVITVTDPVLGKDVTISVAGVALAITSRYVAWYHENKAAEAAAIAAAAAAAAAKEAEEANP